MGRWQVGTVLRTDDSIGKFRLDGILVRVLGRSVGLNREAVGRESPKWPAPLNDVGDDSGRRSRCGADGSGPAQGYSSNRSEDVENSRPRACGLVAGLMRGLFF